MLHGDIIDVHMHCFTSRSHGPAVMRDLGELRRSRVRHLVVVGLVNTRLNGTAMWNLIPSSVENRGDPRFYEADDLLELARRSGDVIIPFVDTRHLWGEVSTVLWGYMAQGFRGLKGIYLPDEDNDLGVGNVPATFAMTLEEYRRREWEIFAFAELNDLPLVYHMDARRYGDVMTALLEDFPKVRVSFAHLGIGRKAFSKILDRYPNVFTDLAGLLPHVRENRASYRDFIMHYADRVCLGSDTLLYDVRSVLDYVEMVRELKLPEEVQHRVLGGNAARFLGSALRWGWTGIPADGAGVKNRIHFS